jgi:1-aminocyclopropane-1-carboxylate deaminase
MQFNLPSPLESLDLPLFREKEVVVYVKRDDLIHPTVSGNKWRKLKYNLSAAIAAQKKGMLTFGGAHSNHLLATAFVCKANGLSSVGIVRGEKAEQLSPTLIECIDMGMELKFVSRTEYLALQTEDLTAHFPNFIAIPEGGANEEGIKGCREIIEEINHEIAADYITVDCGTGATLTGMTQALLPHQKMVGISVLKGDVHMMLEDIRSWYPQVTPQQFEVFTAYHFGGYARYHKDLVSFMQQWHIETGIKTDPLYTAKQFYGVLDLIANDYFPKGSRIVIVHTGGLQGITGYEQRYGVEIYG